MAKVETGSRIQYDGRLFFQTGSSYISTVDQNMSMKFGLLIDVDLRKKVTSLNTKPEVVCSHHGRHIEIIYDVTSRVTRFQ